MAVTALDLVAEAKQRIREIDVAQAQSKLSGALVLDVREPGEYAAGALPGAINIPRGVLEFQIGNHPAFQNARQSELIVYCQSGGRSALAADTLQKLGYEAVVSLAGGYKAWQDVGGATVRP
ncbi:rhodanese-like domain-containing protein [Methylococcus sp. EFPC2]|uniref:rhodanese-like domain-containing protein n=1 Tax=Methylococcus sp. EFPC2 TaxID=2812648 RepID=UPI0019677118|nr:rhodanese-like domain-containing protein [Methylococcus sp. EFPC2]QSA98681.1 rhodanese-like domain-containing protein [Methylococcus sp. EFPC2]